MFQSLLLKTLYDKRGFMFGWTLGSAALLGITALFYPLISDSIAEAFKAVPAALKNVVGEISAYSSYDGYIGNAVFGLRSEMIFAVLAIILGVSLSVTEENNRKLYQLLAQPISRRSVVLQKWVAGTIVIALVIAIVFVALVACTLVIGEAVPYRLLLESSLESLMFTVMLFSVTFGLGVAFGRKSIALLVPIVWLFASLLIDAFAAQISWIADVQWLSALNYYNTSALVDGSTDWLNMAILGGLSLAPLLLALLVFPLRDIRESE